MNFVEIGLVVILLIVFSGPFLNHTIEKNLEVFLFIMGILALTAAQLWSPHVIHEALIYPLPISVVVLSTGFLFKFTRKYLDRLVKAIFKFIPQSLFLFFLIVSLGLLSSVITAIIAALILVELITILDLNRKTEINITIIACFSIGLGAALTPVGEPLSTIVVAKLNENFWFLLKNFYALIIPAILFLGVLAPWFQGRKSVKDDSKNLKSDSSTEVILRAGKVYLFVMALIFLGTGFKPLIDAYVVKLPSGILFWLNITSAILDNATLAAAEVSPALSLIQLKSILMALLISGGILIPGNIPNIIAASKLKITSREWAQLGIPLGLVMMIVYFLILEVF
ncbi:MAG: DUF1646 family protein [Deltaproteobacteria bacterium]|nr:DUF1646 family protein [Deltaproteobacteria bacterium]